MHDLLLCTLQHHVLVIDLLRHDDVVLILSLLISISALAVVVLCLLLMMVTLLLLLLLLLKTDICQLGNGVVGIRIGTQHADLGFFSTLLAAWDDRMLSCGGVCSSAINQSISTSDLCGKEKKKKNRREEEGLCVF